MSAGLDRLIKDASDLADQRIRMMYDALDKIGCESPIEKYFAIALWEGCFLMSSTRFGDDNLLWPRESFDTFEVPPWRIAIWAQQQVFGFRADFILSLSDANGVRHNAVVECDGHDFHERTKEQAARDRGRDRLVQQGGWRMFRFTGSELYANAGYHAIDEVLNGWACNIWVPRK